MSTKNEGPGAAPTKGKVSGSVIPCVEKTPEGGSEDSCSPDGTEDGCADKTSGGCCVPKGQKTPKRGGCNC